MNITPPNVTVTDGRIAIVRTTAQLTPSEARLLARELDTVAEQVEPTPNAEAYRDGAKRHHAISEGDVEVDAAARVSKGDDDGAYVEAWIWVADSDAGLAGEDDDEPATE